MGMSDQTSSFEHRLSQQLHGFGELSEILTLRLLEIEQRLEKLEQAQACTGEVPQKSSEVLLEESEERVRNLQSLLDVDKSKANTLHALPDITSEDHSDENFDYEESEVDLSSDICNPLVEEVEENQEEVFEEECSFEDDSCENEYLDDPQMPLLSA